MKLKATIVSLISVFVVGLTAILLYCFWPAIKGTVDNSKYYTQEELQESYDKGYNDGCKTETELTGQVKYYKSLVDEYYIQVNTLNDEITMLTKNNNDYSIRVSELEKQILNLTKQVEDLTSTKTSNEKTISDLNSQVTELQNEITALNASIKHYKQVIRNYISEVDSKNSQISSLENSIEDKDAEIAELNSQIDNLNANISSLQNLIATKNAQASSYETQIYDLQRVVLNLENINKSNSNTITLLNTQISSLNDQIVTLTNSSQSLQNTINLLNSKINELQSSISFYENFINQLTANDQVVATFEFDGSVYNIQIVNKGSKLSVITPTSTTYKVFNGWKVDGESVDLNTYTIAENTKFIADITYKYDVNFKVDDSVYNNQIIVKNNSATLPTPPTKDGYEFIGWSLNGIDVISNIESAQVIDNITYVAVFNKLCTVTFVFEDETKSTQVVKYGNYATDVTVESTTYKIFNGWSVNNVIVDVNTYKIVDDVTFIANITYKYDVVFIVNNEEYSKQLVTAGECVTLPQTPNLYNIGFEFVKWDTDTTKPITQNTTITAILRKVFSGTFAVDSYVLNVYCVSFGNYSYSISGTTVLKNGTVPTDLIIHGGTNFVRETLRYNSNDDTWILEIYSVFAKTTKTYTLTRTLY